MSEESFQNYINWAIQNYAEEKVKAGNWPEEGSLERSRNEFKKFLKDGLKTEKNYLFSAMDENVEVGILWFAIMKDEGQRDNVWIYDIVVNPDMRGKGYGKAIMEELESKVKELSQNRIGLHVFGHNTVAIELYKKMGYSIKNIVMVKDI